MKNIFRSLVLAAIVVSVSSVAKADTIGLTFTGGSNFTSGSDQLYGWVFTTNAPITVTSLGVFDASGDGTLTIAHDVGIFRQSTQSLLGSTTIAAGTGYALNNGFIFQSVSPFLLSSPDTYVIVMTMPMLTSDLQRLFASTVTTPSEISYVTSAFDGGSTLAFPNSVNNGIFAPGMFGPDFTFVDASTVTPEPSSIAFLGTGLLTVVGIARRRFVRS